MAVKRRVPKVRDLAPLIQFKRAAVRRDQAPPRRRAHHRRPAAHRQTPHPEGGVRLHRRRRRGRAVHRARPTSLPRHRVSPDDPAGRHQCDRRMECAGPAGRVAVRDRADRIHPVDAHRGRDRRRPRRGQSGDPVLAVHAGHLRDRRLGDRCSAGPQMVSAVHVAGSRPLDGVGRSGPPTRVSTRCWSPLTFRSPARGCAIPATG